MNPTTFLQFESAARAEGFDEVLVREWAPDLVLQTHAHPFAVRALVVRGMGRLAQDGVMQYLRAGEGFELAREAPHAEHYGAKGATFWVARRHG
jgi:hypothetical protein